MKTNILYFLLGISVMFSVAATTDIAALVTAQPATPKIVEVKAFRAMTYLESDIKKYIDAKVKEGYIVKSVAMMDDETFSKAIVVMEKY